MSVGFSNETALIPSIQTQHGCTLRGFTATAQRVWFLTDQSQTFSSITIVVTPSPTPLSNDPDKRNLGAIIGGAVGGVAAISAIGLAIFFIQRKKRQEKAPEQSGHELAGADDKAELPWQERHELPGSGTRSPVEAEAKHGQSEANDTEIYGAPG